MATSSINSLGQDQFLRLLTTQLQYQDPLKPLDSTDFIAQLAQFSQLEQSITSNASLGSLVDLFSNMNNYATAGLIGKDVQVEGSAITFSGTESVPLTYSLQGDATNVTLEVFDASGGRRSIALGPQGAGLQTVLWDGRDDNGTLLPAGNYNYLVSAQNNEGTSLAVTTYTQGPVNSISFDNGIALLDINGGQFPVSGLLKITN